MAGVRTFDPGQVALTFGALIVTGFADGSFVRFTPGSPAFTKLVGAQGDVTRVRSRNRTGRIEFTLQQTAPLNDVLSSLLILDQQGISQVAPVALKDLLGTTSVIAEQGWIESVPDVEFSDSAVGRTWAFDLGQALVVVGGNAAG